MRRALEDHDLEPGVGVGIFEGDGEEDVDELVLVPRQESNSQSSSSMSFMLFMLWFVWGEELLLGAIGGFLSTGGPGFFSKFVFGLLSSELEGWIFIVASLVAGFVAGRKTAVVGSRDADFSLCRSDLDDYTIDQLNIGSYREHILEHIQNLHNADWARRYTQIFAPDPVLAAISRKIERKESFRLALQERYLNSAHPGYWSLVIFGLMAHTVTMGGLVGFCILTPNAIMGEFYKIPYGVFVSVAIGGVIYGLRQGYKATVGEIAKYEKERNLPAELLKYEVETRSELQRCNVTYLDLNRLIQEKSRVGAGAAPSTWTPKRPYLPVEEWLKSREAGATFQSTGFFTSGGATLFPRRVKAPSLLTRRAAQAEPQEEQGLEEGRVYDV